MPGATPPMTERSRSPNTPYPRGNDVEDEIEKMGPCAFSDYNWATHATEYPKWKAAHPGR